MALEFHQALTIIMSAYARKAIATCIVSGFDAQVHALLAVDHSNANKT